MFEDYGNIENVKHFDTYTAKLKRWNLGLNIVYDKSFGDYRVKYNDCRLPVALIVNEFNSIFTFLNLSITEKDGSLYFFFDIVRTAGSQVDIWYIFDTFCDLHGLKFLIQFHILGATKAYYTVRILFDDYKKVDSNYMRSIRGIKKFNL